MFHAFNTEWIPSFDIYDWMGANGISFPLLVLTRLDRPGGRRASIWSLTKHVQRILQSFTPEVLESGDAATSGLASRSLIGATSSAKSRC